MKYAKYMFFVLSVAMLAACGNGISTSNNAPEGGSFGLLDLDGDGVADERPELILPIVRAHFYEVQSATVYRRPQVYPLAESMVCRIDDDGNCQPPVYKETVHVSIGGIGAAGGNQLDRPSYPLSLSVDFDLELEGSRRCLDQALDAIQKNASLSIAGYGYIYDAIAYSEGGTAEGSGGSTEPGTSVNVSTDMTIAPDRPIWGNYQNVAFFSLRHCEAVERFPNPLPLPVEPTDPAQPQTGVAD